MTHNTRTATPHMMCQDCGQHVVVMGRQCLYCRGVSPPITRYGRLARSWVWYANPLNLFRSVPEVNRAKLTRAEGQSRITPAVSRPFGSLDDTTANAYNPTHTMIASVIIPAYNAEDTIGEQLAALAAQESALPWEVVVVDNGSTDSTLDIVRRYASQLPRLHVISVTAKQCASYARNRGAEAAAGELLLFCDADDLVAPNWLTAMTTALQSHRFVGCRYDWDKLNPPWSRRVLGTPQAHGPQRITFLPFLCAGGGGLGVHRQVHAAVGGFDEDLAFLEDIDYCQRIQQTGVALAYAPDALVYVRRPPTVRGIYAQARNWARYEQLLFKRYGAASPKELWRWRAFAHETLRYLRRLPQLVRTAEGQALSAWRVGRQVGCIQGSLKYGVPPITGY